MSVGMSVRNILPYQFTGKPQKFFDILKENTIELVIKINTISFINWKVRKKVIKSVRWMPWLSEAMKDVISCDKLR